MSQKSNLITLRKNNFINITTQNSKIWISFLKFIDNLNFLFSKRQILLCNYFIGVENSLVFLELFLFYQQKFFLFKRSKSYRRARNKRLRFSSRRVKKIKSKKKSLLNIFSTLSTLYKLNSYLVKVRVLNKALKRSTRRRLANSLFLKTKKFSNNLFARRRTLYLDFLYLTSLFVHSKITTKLFLNLLGTIFRRLSKKIHQKFVYFIKIVFNFLLKIHSSYEKLPANLLNKKKLRSLSSLTHQILGVKFRVSGRFRAKDRAASKLVVLGNIPTSSLGKDVDFSACHVHTIYGTFGLKIWVHKKKLDNVHTFKSKIQKISKRKKFQQNKNS